MADFTKNMDGAVSTLITERKTWEQGAYAASNAELYNIMAQCYELYRLIKVDNAQMKTFKAMYKARGLTATKGTSIALKVIRLIFDKEGAREHIYARVLRVAFEEIGKGQTLQDFIVERGGVEQIRLKPSKPKGLTSDDYRNCVITAFSQLPSTANFLLANSIADDDHNDTAYAVTICTVDGNQVNAFYTNREHNAVNAALAAAGREIEAEQNKKNAAGGNSQVSDLQNGLSSWVPANLADTNNHEAIAA